MPTVGRVKHLPTRSGRRAPRAAALDPPIPERVVAALRSRRTAGRRHRVVRRTLALVLVALAGALALVRPTDGPVGAAAVIARADLPAGHVLAESDLQSVRRADLPDGAIDASAGATGRTLSAAVRRGELLTDARIVARDGPQPGPDRVATPVRLADQQSVDLLAPGMHVTLIAVDETSGSTTLAEDAVVLGIRAPATAPLSAGRATPVVVFAVRDGDARTVAGSALSGDVTFTFR